MTDEFPFKPVLIIGAARSGTNMLRDALTALPDFETWPCDEINPIWRHGNVAWPNDVIPPERASKARNFIRRSFSRIWKDTGCPRYVVEKTCANTLRVPFVDAIIPEARYIHIIRDGVDVVASAQKRWRGELEVPSMAYYWAKIKYAPLSDLPRYGWSFLRNRIAMKRSKEKRMDVWGPRFKTMDILSQNGASLDEVCAAQWAQSVDAAAEALSTMTADRVLTLHYEAVVSDPAEALQQILAFLGETSLKEDILKAVEGVSAQSVGKGRQALSGDADALMTIMRPTLNRFGYEG